MSRGAPVTVRTNISHPVHSTPWNWKVKLGAFHYGFQYNSTQFSLL